MTQTRTTLGTHGIKCEGCAAAARAALADLPGKTVAVTHDDDLPRADIARALIGAGFPSE